MIAAKQGHGHAVEILLEAGCNMFSIMPVVNSSAIYLLAQLGHLVAFQALFHRLVLCGNREREAASVSTFLRR